MNDGITIGGVEVTSIPPKDFLMLCAPSWARVYIELSFGRDPSLDRLPWDSDSVRREFVSICGFDPAKLQFGNFYQQHEALNIARELDFALYHADEVEELDGNPALQYASGWISCYAWISNTDTSVTPSASVIETEAIKCGLMSSDKQQFVNGFKYRASLKSSFVA